MLHETFTAATVSDRYDKRRKLLNSYTKNYIPNWIKSKNVINSWEEGSNLVKNQKLLYERENALGNLQKVHAFLSTLDDVRFVFGGGWVTIYCNTLDFIDNLRPFTERDITLTTAIIDRPKNTIKLKKSDYAYRMKMRHVGVTVEQHLGVRNFLMTYSQHVRPSISMHQFAQRNWWQYLTTESHYFIDLNDEKLVTMFELLVPGVRDKLLKIIVDK